MTQVAVSSQVSEHIYPAVDWLMFRSYEFNRLRSPHIAAERWRALYLNADVYEDIFKKENPNVFAG